MKFLLTSAGLKNKEISIALEILVGKPLSETKVGEREFLHYES